MTQHFYKLKYIKGSVLRFYLSLKLVHLKNLIFIYPMCVLQSVVSIFQKSLTDLTIKCTLNKIKKKTQIITGVLIDI